MSEFNRSGSRSAITREGKISLGWFRQLTCTVVDISNSGARIAIGEEQELPDTFSLSVEGIPHKRQAEMRWRNGMQVGVEFV